jgi:hypothetical protein
VLCERCLRSWRSKSELDVVVVVACSTRLQCGMSAHSTPAHGGVSTKTAFLSELLDTYCLSISGGVGCFSVAGHYLHHSFSPPFFAHGFSLGVGCWALTV